MTTINRQIRVEAPEATIQVYRTVYGIDTDSTEIINVTPFHAPPAYVEVEASRTINLGDYNSARVGVRIKLPCYSEASEIQRAYNIASEMVDRYMVREENLVLNQGGST